MNKKFHRVNRLSRRTGVTLVHPTQQIDVLNPKPPPGLGRRYRTILPREVSVDMVSLRLLGDSLLFPVMDQHRGIWLRYALRALFGADYISRGAQFFGISRNTLSGMMNTGLRVSRRITQRLENELDDRKRKRRKELRSLALAVEEAFRLESERLETLKPIVSELVKRASRAVRLTQPMDQRTGRFVSRPNRKIPELRE